MKLFLLSILVALIASCSDGSSESELNKSIELTLPGNQRAYIFRSSDSVVYEKCKYRKPGDDNVLPGTKGTYCAALEYAPIPLNFPIYRDALALAYGMDPSIVAEGLESFLHTIVNLNNRIAEEEANPNPKLETIKAAKEKLARYKGMLPTMQVISKYTDALESEDSVLPLDSDLDSSDVKKLQQPFLDRLSTPFNFETSPSTGLLFVSYEQVCWDDAMGFAPNKGCITGPKGDPFLASGTSYNNTLTAPVNPPIGKNVRAILVRDQATAAVRAPSCQTKYGLSWSVADFSTLQQITKFHPSLRFPKFSKEGHLVYTGIHTANILATYKSPDYFIVTVVTHDTEFSRSFALNPSNTDYTIYTYNQFYRKPYGSGFRDQSAAPIPLSAESIKSYNFGVVCAARAVDVMPYADIDQDGIANADDKCNRLPLISGAQVKKDGPRKGCADGEKLDSEIPWLANAQK